ncbi:MAG: FKBP-type peptidyl-prolyl cis-trans isomerase [Candidatus Omnitrophica bacterium]|nr:FKBP-type peptidyl-prolyl cis-trans isomerase [Candidatus Omnitrophota bacterium]
MKRIKNAVFLSGVIAVLILSIAGCGSGSSKIGNGSKVTVQYSINVDGRDVVTDSRMSFVAGSSMLPAALQSALIGLHSGSSKTVALSGAQAYGPVKKELFTRVPVTSLPQNIELKEGKILTLGQTPVRIAKILQDNTVVLDRNNPLAGNQLIYSIKILKIE